MILLFINGTYYALINPSGMVFDLQSILDIAVPILYGYLFCNLISNKTPYSKSNN